MSSGGPPPRDGPPSSRRRSARWRPLPARGRMMKIVVCLHAPPPDPESGTTLGRDDRFALGHALTLAAAPVEGGGHHRVTALLAGSAAEAGPLQRAVAAGVSRAVRLAGEDFRTADFHTVGQALAAGVRRVGGADLVLTGARSDDEGLGAVPASVARQLGYAYVAGVEAIASWSRASEDRRRHRRGRGPRRWAQAPATGQAARGSGDHRRTAHPHHAAGAHQQSERRRGVLAGRIPKPPWSAAAPSSPAGPSPPHAAPKRPRAPRTSSPR